MKYFWQHSVENYRQKEFMMKDFGRVLLMFLGVGTFFLVLYFFSSLNPYMLQLIGIIGSTAMIIWAIYFLGKRKGWRHKPPKDKE